MCLNGGHHRVIEWAILFVRIIIKDVLKSLNRIKKEKCIILPKSVKTYTLMFIYLFLTYPMGEAYFNNNTQS